MTRKKNNAEVSEYHDFKALSALDIKSQQEYYKKISKPSEFCMHLLETVLNEPSSSLLKLLLQIVQMQTCLELRNELLSFFGLPLFSKLSASRLNYEVELCQDQRLNEAVTNISLNLKSEHNPLLKLQAEFFIKFIESLLLTDNLDFFESSLQFIVILLLQPSSRRFIKPILEDKLFPSLVKTKSNNTILLYEFEQVFFYPIDEINGIYYESQEEYIASHFDKIRILQSKLLEHDDLFLLANLPFHSFNSFDQIFKSISQFSLQSAQSVLSLMGLDGYPKNISLEILLDSIASNLVLRPSVLTEINSVYPTETNLFSRMPIRPLTCESLSRQELFQRHQRLLQENLFNELSEHIKENINSCKPVLNRNGKTEFSGWTRDAMEIVSSAVVRTSCPEVQKQGQYQKIEMEVSLPLSPLDKLTLKSWTDLKRSEVVFVCRVDAVESGDFILKYMRSVEVQSHSITKNVLTITLLVDPDQFDMDARTEVFSKFNFIVKRSSSESNDVRLLKSIALQKHQPLPDILEDYILGINHPDELNSTSEEIAIVENDFVDHNSTAVFNCLNSTLSICEGPFGSGCTTVLRDSLLRLFQSGSNSVVLFRSGPAIDKFYNQLVSLGIPEYQIVRLGFSSSLGHIQQKYSSLIKKYVEIINDTILVGLDAYPIYTCGEADYVYRGIIQPRWEAFKILFGSETDFEKLESAYPFSKCLNFDNFSGPSRFETHFEHLRSIFEVASRLAPLELLQSNINITNYALGSLAKIVLMTSKYAAINSKQLSNSGLHFNSLFVDDSNLIPEIEILLAFASQKHPSNLKRLGLFAHHDGGRPQCFNEYLKNSGASITLYDRFIASGFSKTVHLPSKVDNTSPWRNWAQSSKIIESTLFCPSLQFVNVPSIIGNGEESSARNYIQNLDEAEFAVAVFQLMRLNNIPCEEIAILAAYNGQIDLINEVLQTRCNWTEFYGKPAFIGTIDQSIGLQFKNVIVSLVRTKFTGFLSDNSRLELALTRAGDNLIILGSSDLFASKGSFFESLVAKTGNSLKLGNGETFSNVEQIAKYVYNLSVEKLQ